MKRVCPPCGAEAPSQSFQTGTGVLGTCPPLEIKQPCHTGNRYAENQKTLALNHRRTQ